MARVARVEAFAPDEIATVHVMNRVVRRCFLMGNDEFTGMNYDHRKTWVENELKRLAARFGIDLLGICNNVKPFAFDTQIAAGCGRDLGRYRGRSTVVDAVPDSQSSDSRTALTELAKK